MTLFRRKRLARLHLFDPAPSVEGILLGRWAGHYHLVNAKLIQGADQHVAVDGEVEVPTERVLLVQVLE